MHRRFPLASGPVLTGIMAGQTPDELIAEARNAHTDGARGIALDLSDLRVEYRNRAALADIIDAIPQPVMCFFYRDDKQQGLGDEARQEILLAAAEAGAAMIDVMGDLYDPQPLEISHDPEAIARQRDIIARYQAAGAEVVISSHMNCARTSDQVLAHLRALAERGAEVVKIVTTANSEAELTEAIATTMRLKRELGLPFIHLCNGSFGRPHRFLGLSLGTAIAFGVHRYQERYRMVQPTLRAMRAVYDHLAWSVDEA